MKLSIVATMYRSETFVAEFCARMSATAAKITSEYEIVLVNDGSPDNSALKAQQLCEADPHIVLVDLSRNFGHHSAIIAGFEHAAGDFIYLTDMDLQEQPEWLAEFWEKLQTGEHDVVFGVQKARTDNALDNFLGRSFWKFLNATSAIHIPENQMTCRLMTRQYLDSLLEVRDRVIYLGALFPWAGYQQAHIELVKAPRPAGSQSSYRLIGRIRHAIDSITSFTSTPLAFLFLFGLMIWIGSILFGIYLVLMKLIAPDAIASGFTSLMFSIWFLGGLIVLGIGMVGQYVANVFREVKDRPRYIVRSVTRGRKK